MEPAVRENYLSVLRSELITALGCTEPIAIAYAAARARQVLGEFPERATVLCSGNIVKNVKSVTVPNSGGMVGIEIATILGIVGGDADAKLEVLSSITEAHRAQARELLKRHFCQCRLATGVDNLYVDVTVESPEHTAQVIVMNRHTLITKVVKDGEVLFAHEPMNREARVKGLDMTMAEIVEFARTVDFDDIREVIGRQAELNQAISREGLTGKYGARIGYLLRSAYGDDIKIRAIAAAAAGSDARMNGCALPVVINSGSGNQGMTVSLPVLEYAKELGADQEQTYRALVISNLVSIHIKRNIGDLSAFCGAVSAACGAGAAITFLYGGSLEQISNTVINTLANVGGILCDGAKASCAAKIASSLNAAILGHTMSMAGIVFGSEEGIVQEDVERTIKSMGYIGRTGMAGTDVEILKVMLGQAQVD